MNQVSCWTISHRGKKCGRISRHIRTLYIIGSSDEQTTHQIRSRQQFVRLRFRAEASTNEPNHSPWMFMTSTPTLSITVPGWCLDRKLWRVQESDRDFVSVSNETKSSTLTFIDVHTTSTHLYILNSHLSILHISVPTVTNRVSLKLAAF